MIAFYDERVGVEIEGMAEERCQRNGRGEMRATPASSVRLAPV
jgi:hypothetical protein